MLPELPSGSYRFNITKLAVIPSEQSPVKFPTPCASRCVVKYAVGMASVLISCNKHINCYTKGGPAEVINYALIIML